MPAVRPKRSGLSPDRSGTLPSMGVLSRLRPAWSIDVKLTGTRPDNLIASRWLSDVTRILESIEHGEPHAADKLLPLVSEELRKLAASKMVHESPNQTLQPTALVHEAWLRLVGDTNPNFSGRAHFFGAAAEAMRRILIDKARRKRALRHG